MSRKRHRWVDGEDSYIRQTYGKLRPSVIATHLNCTRPALYHRVERLGLKTNMASGEYLRRQSLPRTAKPFSGISNDIEKGYVAGVIDGEGSVVKPPRVIIEVNSTTKPLVRRLQQICGGNITGPYLYRSGFAREKCQPQYKWTMSSMANVLDLLKTILPYLVIKKRDAERGIRYLEGRFKQP